MLVSNIKLDENVVIDPSSSINCVNLGKNVKIGKGCSVYGSADFVLDIGEDTYIGMMSYINGFSAKLIIGKRVSISQFVTIMTDSGPNASKKMQRYYPIEKSGVIIGDDCWIGVGSIIMPGVKLGELCVVAANSYVDSSFPAYSVIGGSPAKIIKKLN